VLPEGSSCLTGGMDADERGRKAFRVIATTAGVVTAIVVGHLVVFLLLDV
jgi:hypothetical protein